MKRSNRACRLGNDSGWLFDHDSQDGYYYDDYNGNTPIAVVSSSMNGSWYFDDSPIGDPGDNHKLYSITLVLASPACNKARSWTFDRLNTLACGFTPQVDEICALK
jgi:hypothetical protein